MVCLSVGSRRCRRLCWRGARSRRSRTRSRPRSRSSSRSLRPAGGRGAFALARELAPLFRGQPLVLLPFFPDGPALLGRQLLQRLVLLPGDPPLLGRQARPGAHLLVDPLLLCRGHFGVTLRDTQPFLLARRIELVPLRGEGRERRLIRWRKLGPGRGTGDDRRPGGGHRRRRAVAGRREQRGGRQCGQRCQLSVPYFNQAGNPRSRYASIGKSEVRMAASVSSMSRTCCTDCQYWK